MANYGWLENLLTHRTPTYSCNIISASYGNQDVTGILTKLLNTSLSADNQFTFTPNLTLFGRDPFPGYQKAVVVVYRAVNTSSGQFGQPQVYRGLDGDPATINCGTTVLPYVLPCPPSNRFIIDATWYTQDVTSKIANLSDHASSESFNFTVDTPTLGPDPAYGTTKQLTITYSEVDAGGTTQFYSVRGKDFDNITIAGAPPVTLKIVAMNYGGKDVTAKAQTLVAAQQTLQIVSNGGSTLFADPWVGHQKSICVLYQYGNRPLELLVTSENDSLSLDPYAPVDPSRFRFLRPEEPRVIAFIWGIMANQTGPVLEDKVQALASGASIPCTSDWFGFDGWPGVTKTCVAFVRRDGGIYDISATEGQTLKL
jgi:hypothetical protein